MAGERSLEGVLAGSGSGAGTPGRLGLLLAMEAGVPIPIPSDLVMLLLGERVSAGALPLWVAALALELVALAGTAALLLAAGRTTPGLRTVTVVAAAGSGVRAGRALPALVLGSSLFLQVHLLLGYALGPAARELLAQARLSVLVIAAVVLAAPRP
jgi:membrane protein DedA with SNARE-associated domain